VVVCDGLTGHISLCRSPKARYLAWLTEVDGGRLEMRLVDMCWKEEIGSCSDVPSSNLIPLIWSVRSIGRIL